MSVLSKALGVEKVDPKQVAVVALSAASLSVWIYHVMKRWNSGDHQKEDKEILFTGKKKEDDKKKTTVSYIRQISHLRKILSQIAGLKEYSLAGGVAVSLVLRTICDLWMMKNGTLIESSIIAKDWKKLQYNMVSFIIAMPSLAFVNGALKFMLNELQLSLRINLSKMLYRKYISGLTYYRINVIDNACPNVDQLLTNDVEKFSQALVHVYSNIAKPSLDIGILVQRMTLTYTGSATPSIVIGYLLFAGQVLIYARKPLSRLTVKHSQLEGQLRYVHSRLIANCEEIAFYQGNKQELNTLNSALDRLKVHLYDLNTFKSVSDYTENFVAKYMAMTMAYGAMAVPFMGNKYSTDSHSTRLESYYESGRMILKLMESFARLLMAGREFARLSAYTQRVTEVMDSMEDQGSLMLMKQKLHKKQLKNTDTPLSVGKIEYCNELKPMIQFINVPIATPNGDVLIKSINITLNTGENCIITGPNGSGKSSFFRTLGELWPLQGGILIKPRKHQLFYIPQKPYLTLGSFRDQIIYPDTMEDVKRKGITDQELTTILSKVELNYLLDRETFDTINDWTEVLSGGEKQRVAIARCIYHKPLYAILDECTSAVSIDVEQRIYQYLVDDIRCSVLSVTHRLVQLQKFHQKVLSFDGNGGYSYKSLGDDFDGVIV